MKHLIRLVLLLKEKFRWPFMVWNKALVLKRRKSFTFLDIVLFWQSHYASGGFLVLLLLFSCEKAAAFLEPVCQYLFHVSLASPIFWFPSFSEFRWSVQKRQLSLFSRRTVKLELCRPVHGFVCNICKMHSDSSRGRQSWLEGTQDCKFCMWAKRSCKRMRHSSVFAVYIPEIPLGFLQELMKQLNGIQVIHQVSWFGGW